MVGTQFKFLDSVVLFFPFILDNNRLLPYYQKHSNTLRIRIFFLCSHRIKSYICVPYMYHQFHETPGLSVRAAFGSSWKGTIASQVPVHPKYLRYFLCGGEVSDYVSSLFYIEIP